MTPHLKPNAALILNMLLWTPYCSLKKNIFDILHPGILNVGQKISNLKKESNFLKLVLSIHSLC